MAGLWAALIALSTLFVKQHFVADVVGGALLAWGSWWLLLGRWLRTQGPESRAHRRWAVLLIPVVLQVLVYVAMYVSYLRSLPPSN